MFLNLKSCFISFIAAGCLVLIALILAVALLFKSFIFDSTSRDIPPQISPEGALQSGGDLNSTPVLKVALISDTENDWVSLEEALEHVSERSILHIIHLGDVTTLGVVGDLVSSRNLLENSGTSYHVIPGDRDLWKSKGVDGFNEVFDNNYGLFDIGGVKWLLIDNANEYEGIDEVQWDYIRTNILEADFIALHNPLYFSTNILGVARKGMGQYSAEVDEQRKELLELVRTSDVKAVFAGDQHLFSVSDDNESSGLQHYVVGALNSERNLSGASFAVLTIYENGAYSVEQVIL